MFPSYKIAVQFAAAGHPILPVWGMERAFGGWACCCGVACGTGGQHLNPNDVDAATTDPDVIASWGEESNYAVRLDRLIAVEWSTRKWARTELRLRPDQYDGPSATSSTNVLGQVVTVRTGARAWVIGPGSQVPSGKVDWVTRPSDIEPCR